jgi:hypothetical protein
MGKTEGKNFTTTRLSIESRLAGGVNGKSGRAHAQAEAFFAEELAARPVSTPQGFALGLSFPCAYRYLRRLPLFPNVECGGARHTGI